MKKCPTCHTDKTVEEFHRARATKDGLNWQCKDCHKKRMKALRTRIAEAEKPEVAFKRCNRCLEVKPSELFSRCRTTRDGLNDLCKSCDRVFSKEKAEKYRVKNVGINNNETVQITCARCGEEKPSDQFNKSNLRKSGKSPYCRECVSKVARSSANRYREMNKGKDPHADKSSMKQCGLCGEFLSLSKFPKRSTTKDGLNNFCYDCTMFKAKKYAENNRSRILFLVARARAAKEGLPFDLKIEDIVIPSHCPVFGIKFNGGKETMPSIDKIIPSMGYTKDNIVVVSMRANRIKSDATTKELVQLSNFYSEIANKNNKV